MCDQRPQYVRHYKTDKTDRARHGNGTADRERDETMGYVEGVLSG